MSNVFTITSEAERLAVTLVRATKAEKPALRYAYCEALRRDVARVMSEIRSTVGGNA